MQLSVTKRQARLIGAMVYGIMGEWSSISLTIGRAVNSYGEMFETSGLKDELSDIRSLVDQLISDEHRHPDVGEATLVEKMAQVFSSTRVGSMLSGSNIEIIRKMLMRPHERIELMREMRLPLKCRSCRKTIGQDGTVLSSTVKESSGNYTMYCSNCMPIGKYVMCNHPECNETVGLTSRVLASITKKCPNHANGASNGDT